MYLEQEYRKYLAQVTTFREMLIAVDKAEGIYIFDKKGKKYFDLLSGIAVNILGHRHPAIVETVKRQADRYLHLNAYGEFIQEESLQLAKKLASLLPENLNKSFFVNSGSESIEGAIKLAKLYNGRSEVIAFSGSYHGSTLAALNLLGNRRFKSPFLPLIPDVRILTYNDFDGLKNITERTSCVVYELIQTASGMHEAQSGFVEALRERCNQTDTLLIFDEIQTSPGRLGTMFGFQKFKVVPDILCLAKSMGGGIPFGAFISSDHIMKSLDNGHPLIGHATTFGGNPLACALASTVLDVLIKEDLPAQVEQKHLAFRKLEELPFVRKIQGKGLLLAVYPDPHLSAKDLIRNLLSGGIITNSFLFRDDAFAIIPPLTISQDEIEMVCQTIGKVISNS